MSLISKSARVLANHRPECRSAHLLLNCACGLLFVSNNLVQPNYLACSGKLRSLARVTETREM
jgi:hypothetical protein